MESCFGPITKERKYLYLTYRLSDCGNTLWLRRVSREVVPPEVTTQEAAQKHLKQNLHNPALFMEGGKELIVRYEPQARWRRTC